MKKSISVFFTSLIASIVFVSCNNDFSKNKFRDKIFSQWTGKILTIPEDFHIVNNKDTKSDSSLSFLHYFNGECNGCIGHIKKIKPYIEKLKKRNVKLYLVTYTHNSEFTEKMIKKSRLDYTIYIDTLNSLYFENRFNSPYLESFLLDSQNKILCVGELKDKKFRRKLQKLINKQK